MPSGWRERHFGELTENFDNVRVPVKEADRRAGPYPYYGASGVVDSVDGYLFDGEYLLIAEDGENLRTRTTPVAFLANGKFWVNNHAHIVRANGEADTRFLMYALGQTDISGYLTGSTMPKLTQGNMDRIPILAPPRGEQRAVARVLGALDDKIELNRKMSETLEQMARAIFKSWFVDFKPFRSEGMVDTPLGEIPTRWKVGTVADACSLVHDAITPLDTPNEEFAHFSIPAYDAGKEPASERGSEIKSNKNLVPAGCVLLSKLNPRFPRVWYVDMPTNKRAIASTEFLVAIPVAAENREYLYGLLTSRSFMTDFERMVTGTSSSHQRVPAESLLSLACVVPDGTAIRAYGRITRPMLAQVQQNTRQSRTLAAIRDALLPKLMSGKVRVAA